MKEHEFPQDKHQLEDGLQRLIEDLKRLNTSGTEILARDEDSLSLIVDEALKGVDIRTRYPAFYDHLLRSFALRSMFIECVQDLKETVSAEVINAFQVKPSDLAFLHHSEPTQISSEPHWKVTLLRSAEQLMTAFFAPQLGLRGADSSHEPSITLLRSEFLMQDTTYSVILQGRLHDTRDDVLLLSLNVAAAAGKFHPLQSSLQWGSFKTSIAVSHEGSTPLPDLPFSSVFNDSLDEIVADLHLTLTVAA